MRGRPPLPLVNSATAFALALLVTITVHEFAHAAAAVLLGSHPVVHPFSVDPNVVDVRGQVFVDLAGPIVSLLVGLGYLAASARIWSRSGFVQLLLLWLGLLGSQEFFGYLSTAPFVPAGDIAAALQGLAAPPSASWVCLVVGVVGTYFIGSIATRRLIRLTDPGTALGRQLRHLGLFAWLLGSAGAMLLSIGSFDASGTGLFEVVGALSSGVFLIYVRFFMRRAAPIQTPPMYTVPWAGILCVLALAAARLAALHQPGGLRL